jgi:probable phosphoglycerate mutase
MRTVYLVTHPEATHHVQALVGGWYDAALTARGAEHARRIAVALRGRIPTGEAVQVFSSDLRRTRQTAGPIAAALGVDVAIDAALREQSYGDAEGRPAGTLRFVPPPAVGDRLHHHDGVKRSETRWEVATRAYAALDRLLAGHAQRFVIVTHGGVATFLIAAWIAMPIESAGYVKFRTTPGGITVLVEDDDFHDRQVAALNDISHLD